MSRKLDWLDSMDLAAHLLNLGKDYEVDDVEQALADKYGISFDAFSEIVEKLVPLCEVAKSPLSDEWYRGFADRENHVWLVKEEM